jgi:F-type H+-transporting ATPase subunit a
MIFFAIIGATLSSGIKMIPKGVQNVLELVVEGIADFMDENMGHGGRRYIPLIGTLGLFILVSNLSGMFPGFSSPTANINTNAAMAIIVFVSYNFIGIRKHGLIHYLKNFTGPIPWLAPLMLPIEMITHFARPLALTMRLFGNIYGEELVLLILAFLMPFMLPVPMMFLGLITSTIQSVVFSLLSMFYIAGALEEGH